MNREIMQQVLNIIKLLRTHDDEQATEKLELISAFEQELANYEKPLPPVDIGVDVTPEGTHVVACYNRPDSVQEMFYSQFHPLAKPEQNKPLRLSSMYEYGHIHDASQPEQEPVAQIRVKKGYWIETPRSIKVKSLPDGLHDLYTAPPRKEWVGLTDDDLSETYNDLYTQYTRDDVNIADFILIARTIESTLKEKNT